MDGGAFLSVARADSLNQEEGGRNPMRSVNDLQLMFLERIAIETPEATARLFELRDAGKWQAEYRVSADWLDLFLRDALAEGQAHMDWIKTNVSHLWLSGSAAAWLRALAKRRAAQAILRMAEKAAPDQITYRDPKEDKRGVSRQCCARLLDMAIPR